MHPADAPGSVDRRTGRQGARRRRLVLLLVRGRALNAVRRKMVPLDFRLHLEGAHRRRAPRLRRVLIAVDSDVTQSCRSTMVCLGIRSLT